MGAEATMANQCLFWDCTQYLKAGHTYCYNHYAEYTDGIINKCSECGRAKYAEYDACLDCYNKRGKSASSSSRKSSSKPKNPREYELEYSPAWESGDADAFEFFVYVLKLSDNSFYVGQTRDLRPRLSEHRDNKVKSTARKRPELAWFTVVPSRRDATELEAEFKEMRDKNERLLRRIIIDFEDSVKEMAIYKDR